MKTILYVFHCSSIGGGSYCLLNILKNIDRLAYKPVVLLASRGPLVDEIKKLDIDIYFISGLDSIPYNVSLLKRGTISKYRKVYRSMTAYINILKDIAPDLVYINSMMLYPYLKPAYELGINTIIHIREHWPLNEHVYQLRRAQKFIRDYSSYVLAINEFASKQIPGVEDKLSIIYDWIDLNSRYKYIPLNALFQEDVSNKRVVLFTGGSAPNKGAKEVVQIFSEYLNDRDLRMLILGHSTECMPLTFRDKVKQVLSRLHILSYYAYELNELIERDDRIVCVPNIYEVKHLLDQCYCQVSFFTIPHANLAMAECIVNNTVCLGARTEESEEYSFNGELAFLCDINDKMGFVEAFHRLEKDYSLMKDALSKKSYMIREKFDPAVNVQKLNDVYKSLLR